MVKIHVKRADESCFLFETTVESTVADSVNELVRIQNGRLKVQRIAAELEGLAEHGVVLPQNMQGMTDEQIEDLHLHDEYEDVCIPSGGYELHKDDIGRRNGRAPKANMREVLQKTRKEALALVAKDLVQRDTVLTYAAVQNALDILRGAVMIVYPMNLPPNDPVRLELENKEDLSGTQASLEVLEPEQTSMWFSGKEMRPDGGKKLGDYLGKNEKTKVICKLQKRGQGPPAREPVMTEDDQKNLMAYYHRKQEEEKKLSQAEDDAYMGSGWADSKQLSRQMHGLGNVKWGPR